MKSNMGFEENIKQVLENYTVPYNSADWDQLEKSLDSSSKKGNLSTGLFYGALLTAALTFTGVLWYMSNTDDSNSSKQNTANTELVENTSNDNNSANGSPSISPVITGDGSDDNDQNKEKSGRNIGSMSISGSDIAQANKDIDLNFGVETDQHGGSTKDKIPSNVDRENIEKIDRSNSSANKHPKDPSTRNNFTPKGNNDEQNIDNKDQEMAISFSTNTTDGCPGTSINFDVTNMPDEGRYLWNFGDGSFSNKPDPEHTFDKPGTYEVTLLITSLGDGTMHSEPARDLIVIHDAPYSDFSWELEANSNEIPVIHFENTSQNGVKWHWDLGDGSTSIESHPEHIYKKKGAYQVTLTATNPNGCVDKVTRMVEVANDYKLLAPNTFSPNDDGTNDLFIPEALKILDISFKMSIFEPKTGRLIYETTDVNAPWNGRVNNKSAACEKGEYVWVIDIMEGFNAQESYNGKVTLLR